MSISTFWDWLTVQDYSKAKAESAKKIMGRYSRGNVLVQDGQFVEDHEMARIIARGDKATARLKRSVNLGR